MTRWFTNSSTTLHRRRTFRPHAQALEGRRLMSAGDLDPTFGQAGVVFTSVPAGTTGTGGPIAMAVKPLSNGTLLVGGRDSNTSGNVGTNDFGLARYTAQGVLDTTFGTGGRTTTDFKGKGDLATDMAVLASGKILMAGYADTGTGTTTNYDFALARYLPGGALDATFGPSRTGKVTTSISKTSGSQYDLAYGLAVQADGKIVLVGQSQNGSNAGDPTLVRYNADGSLDTTFGPSHTGKVVTPLGTMEDTISAIGIQPLDGKIVVAGCAGAAGNRFGFFVARYNTDGTLDTAFGPAHNGIVITPVGSLGAAIGSDLALQPDGSIVVAGRHFNGVNWDATLMRYTPAGGLDGSFGSGGIATLGPVHGLAYGLTLQPDGKLVVVGAAQPDGSNTTNGSFIARVLTNGTLDPSFAGSGIQTVSGLPSGYSYLRAVSLQANGMIVAVGGGIAPGTDPSTSSYMVARFQADPAPLLASAVAPAPVHQALTATQARPALTQALVYWRAHGEETSRLGHLDLAIADLGGDRLGEASGSTITLDDNAAGWGWNLGRAAGRGRGAASGRMDLLSAVVHEVGHLLGHDHAEGGVMAEALAPGVRQVVAGPGLSHAPTRSAIESFRVHGRRSRATARG